MSSRQRACLAMAIGWVLGATGMGVVPTASAVSAAPAVDVHSTADDPDDGGTVIVPGKPGEQARTVSGESLRALARTTRDQANQADKRFVQMMIPHHYQAILMTRLSPERSADQRVRAIAERINVAQSVETDAMQGWQGREGLPVTDPQQSYEHMLRDPAMLEQMGMATPQEMQRLRASQGEVFDTLFLQLMIPHHEGAITMAEEVAGSGRDLFVRQLAVDIISSQSRQIYDMRQLLEQ